MTTPKQAAAVVAVAELKTGVRRRKNKTQMTKGA